MNKKKIVLMTLLGIVCGYIFFAYANNLIEAKYVTYDGKMTDYNNAKDAVDSLYDKVYECDYPVNFNFNFGAMGSYQKFVTPCTGYYKLETWGASGGDSGSYTGGNGAYTSGTILLTEGITLYVYVGIGGSNINGAASQDATFNGGGAWSSNISTDRQGGGASDIRYFSEAPSTTDLTWNSSIGLKSRIMVAAGGGGGAYWSGDPNGEHGYGGAGGNLVGISPTNSKIAAGGGTQTSGGYLGGGYGNTTSISGSFGLGGTGWYGAGGGSGYYGGGGASWQHNAGACGSSYISGYQGCVAIASSSSLTPRNDSNGVQCTETSASSDITCSYHYSGMVFTNTNMIAGTSSMPTHDGTGTMTGNDGNGYARITYLGKSVS